MGRGILLTVSLSSMLGGFVAMVVGARTQGGASTGSVPGLRIVIPITLIIIALLVAAWTVYLLAFCKRASPPKRRYYRRIRFEGDRTYFDRHLHEYTLDRDDPATQRTDAVYEMAPRKEYEFIPPDAITWQGRRKRR